MGMNMTGWYDIASLDGINQQEDEEGLTESKRCGSACIPDDSYAVMGTIDPYHLAKLTGCII